MPQVKILIIPRKDGFSRYENITGNFLITSSAGGVNLRAFQMRDMTLTELARSVAFLSQGALTVEVVAVSYTHLTLPTKRIV